MTDKAKNSYPMDPLASTLDLPETLHIPIAAADTDAIEKYVGVVVAKVKGRGGRVNAQKVQAPVPDLGCHKTVPLWASSMGNEAFQRLHPAYQLWVHVDYEGYRKAWTSLDMPRLDSGIVLDHIWNRQATRIRGYIHPYLRLAPVASQVNTNAGHRMGGEGMEREFMESLQSRPVDRKSKLLQKMKTEMVYADPMDLTKMIDIAPGTHCLEGVRETQKLFYP